MKKFVCATSAVVVAVVCLSLGGCKPEGLLPGGGHSCPACDWPPQ